MAQAKEEPKDDWLTSEYSSGIKVEPGDEKYRIIRVIYILKRLLSLNSFK